MLTREELEGRWKEIRGQLKQKWGQLSDDELSQVEGSTDQLVGLLQRKTGETREQIVKFLDSIGNESEAFADQAAHAAKRYAKEASQAMSQGYEKAAHAVQENYEMAAQNFQAGYEQAEAVVRRNPLESIAVAFGSGLIAGVLVSVILRSK